MPAGLTFSGAGVITGTPTAVGAYSIAVRVTDNAGTSVTQNLAFTASVFNLFNNKTTLSQVDGGEDPADDYQRPLSFQTPRYLQLGVTYDFSL